MRYDPIKIGLVFGRWVVLADLGIQDRRHYWLCGCQCGSPPRSVLQHSLKTGVSISCGCAKKETLSLANSTHGCSRPKSAEYAAWTAMRARCLNPRHKSYPNYGGRGITICKRWLDSFEDFLADVGYRPSIHYSLDRFPNNNGHYEPGNVRWATVKQQVRNRRNNRLVTINGETLCVGEWVERFGLHLNRVNAAISTGRDPVEVLLSGAAVHV